MVAKAGAGGKAHGGLCGGCGYQFPPGADTCPVCGRVEPRRGDPYPVGKVERQDWVDAQHVGNASAKNVLGALVRHDRPWNKTPGTVWPGVKRLALMTESSESTVYRALAHLEDEGWIEVTRKNAKRSGYREPNRYTIWSPYHRPALGEPTSQYARANLAN